jgi:4-amino-4-deoxy-L-arabinose transferase-like glycosyltransferase
VKPSRGFHLDDRFFAILLFIIALAPRVWVALEMVREPVWDGHYYDFGARRIAAGLGYSDDTSVDGFTLWHPWCHYPVGYSGYLAFFYRIFGSGPLVAPLVNAATGAMLAVLTWMLARHALVTWRARIAGLIVALHPGLILYSGLVMSEPLAALLTLGAFWLAVRDAQPRGMILGALTLGVAALVRPQALLCAPFLAMLQPATPDEDTPLGPRRIAARRIAQVLVVCIVTLVPVLPWTARNCRVMDGCALVSTNAGWNLAIGAFPRATGRFETLRPSDGCTEVTGQVQQDRCWFAYGAAQIRATPRRWLALVPKKLSYTFDHESFAVEYLREANPSAWPEARRVQIREVISWFHRVLLVIASLGCVALRFRGRGVWAQGIALVALAAVAIVPNLGGVPTFWPLVVVLSIVPWLPIPGRPPMAPALKLALALLATTVLTHAVFFGEDRYHMVVTPVLALLAASALRKPAEEKPTLELAGAADGDGGEEEADADDEDPSGDAAALD